MQSDQIIKNKTLAINKKINVIQKRNQTTDVSILSGLFPQNGWSPLLQGSFTAGQYQYHPHELPSYLKILEHR